MATHAKKKKTASHHGGSKKHRILLALFVVIAALLAILILTEPRQLPAVIADHPAVRSAYLWRDSTYTAVHNWMYPLSTLRAKEVDPERDGVGYKKKDRDALDQLLEGKESTTP